LSINTQDLYFARDKLVTFDNVYHLAQ
jgi:hypothetical protein